MASLDELRSQVLFGARVLAAKLDDVWGHVTVRFSDPELGEGFLLKHLRIPSLPVDPDEVMAFGYDGMRLQGTQDDPWEVPLYTATYAARPEVNAVVHVHPPVATALASAGATIHAASHEGLEFGDGLPSFGGEVIDTTELGAGMASTLGSHPGCMLRGHGAVLVGAGVPEAVVRAIYLERTAKQLVWASAVGTAAVLPKTIGDHITSRRAGATPQLWRYLQWEEECRGETTRT